MIRKSILMTWQLVIPLLLLIIVRGNGLFAQSESPGYRLVLENAKKDKTIEVKENRRIRIWLTDEMKSSAYGKYEIIDDQTISVDGEEYSIDQIKRIRFNPSAIQTLGVVSFSLGAGTIPLAVLVSVAEGGSHFQPIGLGMFTTSAGLMALGAVATFRKYNFQLNEEWSLIIKKI